MNNLAALYVGQVRYADVSRSTGRSLAISEKALVLANFCRRADPSRIMRRSAKRRWRRRDRGAV